MHCTFASGALRAVLHWTMIMVKCNLLHWAVHCSFLARHCLHWTSNDVQKNIFFWGDLSWDIEFQIWFTGTRRDKHTWNEKRLIRSVKVIAEVNPVVFSFYISFFFRFLVFPLLVFNICAALGKRCQLKPKITFRNSILGNKWSSRVISKYAKTSTLIIIIYLNTLALAPSRRWKVCLY